MRQRKTNTVWPHRYAKSNKIKLTETEPSGGCRKGGGVGKMSKMGQKVQTFSYKISKFWGCNAEHREYSYNTWLYVSKLLREYIFSQFSSQEKTGNKINRLEFLIMMLATEKQTDLFKSSQRIIWDF